MKKVLVILGLLITPAVAQEQQSPEFVQQIQGVIGGQTLTIIDLQLKLKAAQAKIAELEKKGDKK